MFPPYQSTSGDQGAGNKKQGPTKNGWRNKQFNQNLWQLFLYKHLKVWHMAKGRPHFAGLQETEPRRWVEVTREAVFGSQDVQYSAAHRGSGSARVSVVT